MLGNEIAIVTGAARGIGRAIALDLARHGASLVINYRSSERAAESLRREIEEGGTRAICVQADVTNEAHVRGLFRSATEELGVPTILVNNAGITADGLASMMSLRKWRAVLEADLDSVFLCCRQAMRVMARERRGSIVNVSSISGAIGLPGQANYSAAKAGVIALTKVLAREGGPLGIRVNAVAPGFVETEMLQEVPSAVTDVYKAMVPLGRIAQPLDVAPAVTFLVSDGARYVNGHTLTVDGGLGLG